MVTSDWEPKVPVLIVDYNQPVARNIGLSRQDIGLADERDRRHPDGNIL